ncbi:MAG: hypothetical protein JWR19_3806 [Pedosphaera sp.]|jgi:hypothetical protein|nr:hypothetical protein [Pedosphaera sp.]
MLLAFEGLLGYEQFAMGAVHCIASAVQVVAKNNEPITASS